MSARRASERAAFGLTNSQVSVSSRGACLAPARTGCARAVGAGHASSHHRARSVTWLRTRSHTRSLARSLTSGQVDARRWWSTRQDHIPLSGRSLVCARLPAQCTAPSDATRTATTQTQTQTSQVNDSLACLALSFSDLTDAKHTLATTAYLCQSASILLHCVRVCLLARPLSHSHSLTHSLSLSNNRLCGSLTQTNRRTPFLMAALIKLVPQTGASSALVARTNPTLYLDKQTHTHTRTQQRPGVDFGLSNRCGSNALLRILAH